MLPLIRYCLSFFICVVLTNCAAQVNPIVQTNNGLVQGKQGFTIEQNRPYYSFRGIPFAEPPIGELRFEPPVPTSNWDGVLDATKDKDTCVQNSDPVVGTEDCLYINVYTPTLPSDSCQLLPVFFWIYGGGFTGGNSSYESFGPDYILEKDVIVITFNYRLGIFGFLSTGDTVAPGNAGLKDQVLALEWTKNNIQYFCGNPNQITIAGQSAGAASVGYHLQSPLSQGLYQQAMLSSGTSLNLWALSRITQDTVRAVAVSLGVNILTSQSLVDGLKAVDATTLQSQASTITTLSLLTHNPRLGFAIGPVSEPDHPGAFFSGKSYEKLKNGQFTPVKTFIGFNSLEGAYTFDTIFRIYLAQFDLDNTKLLPPMNTPPIINLLPAAAIKTYYFNLNLIALSDDPVMRYLTDDQFVRPIRKFAQFLQTKPIQVYLYRFSYEGGLWGFNGTDRPFPGIINVTHSEELGYYWVSAYPPISSQDIVVRTRMVTIITNFVKYGNPTPTADPILQNIYWPSLGTELHYVDIGTNLQVLQKPESANMTFWDNLYQRYGIPPYDTF